MSRNLQAMLTVAALLVSVPAGAQPVFPEWVFDVSTVVEDPHRDHLINGSESVAANGQFWAAADGLRTVFRDFDFTRTWSGWTATGTAFGSGAAGEMGDQIFDNGGAFVANSRNNPLRDAAVGQLRSPAFVIEKPWIRIPLYSGNGTGALTVQLVVDGVPLRTESGPWDGAHLISWDVAELVGRTARIEIIDNSTATGGYLAVQKIEFEDTRPGIFRSSDGRKWHRSHLPPNPNLRLLPQYGEKLVYSVMAGTTWSFVEVFLDETTVSSTAWSIRDVCWDGTRFTAVGSLRVIWRVRGGFRTDVNPVILTSPDGVAWTQVPFAVLPVERSVTTVTSPSKYDLHSVAGNGVVTLAFSDTTGLRLPEPAGMWTEDETLWGYYLKVSGGKFFRMFGFNSVRVSDDGITWDSISRPPPPMGQSTQPAYGVAYGRGVWAMVGRWRTWFSADAKTWVEGSRPGEPLRKVAFESDRFVAFGDYGLRGEAIFPEPPTPISPTIPNFPLLRISGGGLSALTFLPSGQVGTFLANEGTDPDSGAPEREFYYSEWNLAAGARPANAALVAERGQFLREAMVLTDSFGRLYLFADSGGEMTQYRREGAEWIPVRKWEMPTEHLAGAAGLDGSFHFVAAEVVDSGTGGADIVHVRLSANGQINQEVIASNVRIVDVTQMSDFDDLIDYRNHEARNLGIAVDKLGVTHVVFSGGRVQTPIFANGQIIGTEIRSDLRYARKAAGGNWENRVILAPPGGEFGDYGGLGASIAAAPNGVVAVAASIIPRVRTGSPGVARLVYTEIGDTLNWRTVNQVSAVYRMGDGERGTGLFPRLGFDGRSRPHIIYTDHASEHFPGRGAKSFSGQVRYSHWSPGGWNHSTIFDRGGARPMDSQIFHPALAVREDGSVAILANAYRWSATSRSWARTLRMAFVKMTPRDPEISVEEPANVNRESGAAVAFGTVARGFSSRIPKRFVIRNTGTGPLAIHSAHFTGANPGDFAMTAPKLPLSIAPKGSISLSITFRPTGLGAREANLVLASTDEDEPTFSLLLTGSGTEPDFSLGTSEAVSTTLPSTFTASGQVVGVGGLPAGLRYDLQSGTLTGRPTKAGAITAAVRIRGGDGKIQTVPMTLLIEPMPAWATGSFTGLIHPPEPADSTLVGLGGSLHLTVAASGLYTGTIRLGGKAFPIRGWIEGKTAAERGSDPLRSAVTIVPVRSDPGQNIDLVMEFRPENDLQQPGLAGQLTYSGRTLRLASGWRHVWNATQNPAFGNRDRLLNVVIEAPGGPGGDGFASIRLTKTGVATWSARLPDGVRLTGSHTVTPDGEIPLYAPINYPGGGVVLASVATGPAGAFYHAPKATTPNGIWIKRPTDLPKAVDRIRREGFEMDLSVYGAEYRPPTNSALLFGATVPGASLKFSLRAGGVDGPWQLEGADPLERNAQLLAGNRFSVDASPAPMGVRFLPAFAAASGALTGSVSLSDPHPFQAGAKIARTLSYSGLYVPDLSDPGRSRIRGFFLLPTLPASAAEPAGSTAVNSGIFELSP